MQQSVLPKLSSLLRKLSFILLATILFCGLNNNLYAQIYVDIDASGANDGTSWSNAYNHLQDALVSATGSDEIWIAEGTYYPDEGADQTQGDRSASFYIPGTKDGLKIYGGFSGSESSLEQRNLAANKTILSGDIEGSHDGDLAGNSFHVVFFDGIVNTLPTASFSIGEDSNNQTVEFTNESHDPDGTIVSHYWEFGDGATSTSKNSTRTYDSGGDYTVTLTVTDNHGGKDVFSGIVDVPNEDDGGFPTMYRKQASNTSTELLPITNATVLSDIIITGGNASESGDEGFGAGIFCDGEGASNVCSPSLKNLVIANNHSAYFGAGLYNDGQDGTSSPILNNVIFAGNEAGSNGAAMYNHGGGGQSNPALNGVTFYNNSAVSSGGGIYNYSAADGEAKPVITNSIFYGNVADSDNDGTGIGDQIANNGDEAVPEISHSLIANSGGSSSWNSDLGTDGGGNLDVDPLFVDGNDPDGPDDLFGTNDDGMMLRDSSPAINAGTNTPFESGGVAEGLHTDLAGNTRIYDGSADPDIVDMGAYEFQGEPAEENEITPSEENVLYVDVDADGNATGNSWDDAIPQLAEALKWAGEQDDAGSGWTESDPLQIWVAEGTYNPGYKVANQDFGGDPTTERDQSFLMVPNVQIYGGFVGTETSIGQRPEVSNTILSGDLDGNDSTDGNGNITNNGENVYHVIMAVGDVGSAIIDGLTISGANANFSNTMPVVVNEIKVGRDRYGGMVAMDSSPTLRNVTFTGNTADDGGGGMYTNSSPMLTNVTFADNSAGTGGGLFNAGSPTLKNVDFVGNSAGTGGGMYSMDSFKLTNVRFTENTASNNAGGMYTKNSPALTNVTFTDNESNSNGGGIFNAGSPTLNNVILWGNTAAESGNEIYNYIQNSTLEVTISHSLYGNSSDDIVNEDLLGYGVTFNETENIHDDPQFADPDNGDYTLLDTSPAINAGTNTPFESGGVAEGIHTDLAGNTRIYDGSADPDIVDMGAYEFQGDPSISTPAQVVLTSPGDEAVNIDLQPEFSWESVENADQYELQVSDQSDLSSPIIDQADIEENTFQPMDDLNYSTTYYWRVRGKNSGGAGEWSEVFSFKTVAQPEGSDQRIFTNNAQPYEFKASDFGIGKTGYSIKIQTLPASGTVEYQSGPVSADDQFPAENIENGDLVWIPPAGEYGYDFTSFDFVIVDSNNLESDESYTMTIDVGTTTLQLTGDEGWRFIGNPSDGDVMGDFLGPIWTQGMKGSDSPDAWHNIFVIHQSAYEWAGWPDMSETTTPGGSILVYVFSDDDNDGNPEGFPKTLTTGDNWESLEQNYVYEALKYYPDQGNQGDSHILLANPHPFGIDFCEMYAKESVNVANSVDIWDSSANDGNGDYINLNCSVEDVVIAPFQGFWIRTTNQHPELEIPESAYLENNVDGYFKQPRSLRAERSNLTDNEVKESPELITLNISNAENTFSSRSRILFSEEASKTLDAFDAPKLSPEGLANRWLSFYSLDEQNKAYTLQSLPANFEEKVRIPLDIQTTESGRFTLDWTLPESHVFEGSYFLKDNQTDEVIELREGSSYNFDITSEQAVQTKQADATPPMSEVADPGFTALDTHRMSSEIEPRFELLIARAGVDGMTELGAVPEEFTLAQNYPNPFNPTTVISYQLPVSSEVRLEVYDMLGRNVATLVNEQVAAGRHRVNFDASNLSSGIYLYRLQAGSQIMTKKLTVVK